MRILIAPDSFKDSLSATGVSEIMEKGLKQIFPTCIIDQVPLSDGGEGFTDALLHAVGGWKVQTRIHDPLMRSIDSFIGLIDNDKTAVIEMATASGLELLKPRERNPLVTSSYGTGELIRLALDHHCKKIIIGAGGSATVDGGIGAVQALGGRFLDKYGNELSSGGGNLDRLTQIDLSWLDKRLKKVKIQVACDVTNPFTGKEGAAIVYAPQKGATPEMTNILENNLSHLSELINDQLGIDLGTMTFAGAAGGLAGGLISFLRAEAISGFDLLNKITGLNKRIRSADLILTGEGKTDRQTLFGKAPYALARVASRSHVPVIVFTGWFDIEAANMLEKTFTAIIPVHPHPLSLDEALAKTKEHLMIAVISTMKLIKTGIMLDKSN